MGEIDETIAGAVEGAKEGESRLNSIIAVAVAIAATLMALDNIKDGNVTQAMAQAQAHAVDTWSYYQAKSTKQNLAEAMLDQLQVARITAPAASIGDVDKRIESYKAQVARYEKEKNDVKAQAEGFEKEYDALNVHDDQFDLSDAGFSVAIALLGVTALTRKRWLLFVAGAFLLVGITFGLAGFFNLGLHPDAIMSWMS